MRFDSPNKSLMDTSILHAILLSLTLYFSLCFRIRASLFILQWVSDPHSTSFCTTNTPAPMLLTAYRPPHMRGAGGPAPAAPPPGREFVCCLSDVASHLKGSIASDAVSLTASQLTAAEVATLVAATEAAATAVEATAAGATAVAARVSLAGAATAMLLELSLPCGHCRRRPWRRGRRPWWRM